MTDINWPAWSRDGQRLLELMPTLGRRAFTRGEVLALGDGWAIAWRDPEYQTARRMAFSALFAHNPNTIRDDAWGVASKRAAASGEWRDDLLNHACHATTDAAIGRFVADWADPAITATLERVWLQIMEVPGRRPAEPVLGPPIQHHDPDSASSFVGRCQSHGWDEAHARSLVSSTRNDAALRRCREATLAAGRDALAKEAAFAATAIGTPGGCYPDEGTMLADQFLSGLARTAEAVVARDLLHADDFDILLETWRARFGDLD